MKRFDNLAYKKKTLDDFCKHRKCKECPLIITEYCQRGDKSASAINKAFDIYLKGVPNRKTKRKV